MGKEHLADIIKRAGYKVTQPRLFVLALLESAQKPASVSELCVSLKKQYIDTVTAYRTLETFKKAGIVRQIDLQHGRAYFELADKKSDHHHIVCVKCDKVEDFVGCEYEKLAEKTLKQSSQFKKIIDHSLEFFGVCKSCAHA